MTGKATRDLGWWRRRWAEPPFPGGKWWCEALQSFRAHCSEASVMIHPERHTRCGWRGERDA